MAHHGELCDNTKFVDVDFQELMLSKREIILNTPRIKDMLAIGSEADLEHGIVLDSSEYTAIGCDLRNLRRLERLLRSVVDIEQCLVLCVAEVSITYMATQDADALIQWTTGLCPGIFDRLRAVVLNFTETYRCNILSPGTAVPGST